MQPARRQLTWILLVGLFLTACAGGSTSTRTSYEDRDYADRVYDDLLVVAVAADYNARARFERSLAGALRSARTDATGYHQIAAGDQEITREKILAAIDDKGYDGVVVTRIGSRESEVSVKGGSTEAKVSRRDGSGVDFFRYDYEILNEPHQVNLAMTLRLVTDFFDAKDARLIWTGESTVSDKRNISYRLDETAQSIATRMRIDGLLDD